MGAYATAVLADNPWWYFHMPQAGANATQSVGFNGGWWGGANSAQSQSGWSGVEADSGSLLLLGLAGTAQSRVFSASQWSLEFWVYQGGQSSGTVQTTNNYALLDEAGVSGTFFGVGASGGDWTWTAGSGPNTTTGHPFLYNAWHHVVLTYTTLATLYVDGTAIFTSGAFSQAAYTSARLVCAEVETYPTWLAELALYNVALSATRVAAHNSAATPGTPVYRNGLSSACR